MPDDADEKDDDGDALPPEESDLKRQKSGTTALVSQTNQRFWFPADFDALMGIQVVDAVDTNIFENNRLTSEPRVDPSGLA